MTTTLLNKQCSACNRETPILKGPMLKQLIQELAPGWKVVTEHHLERDFPFADFRTALDFVNRVGDVAETENHHPNIFLTWGKVGLKIWTHAIDGLSENDFILAAKVDQLNAVKAANERP
jgi:4a-hydroxytetrahydrobiopterin dehydratase